MVRVLTFDLHAAWLALRSPELTSEEQIPEEVGISHSPPHPPSWEGFEGAWALHC